MKENFPGSFFYNTSLDAVILLSIFELFNVISIWLYFDIKPVSGSDKLDIALLGLILIAANSLGFLLENRFQKVIERVKTMKMDIICYVLSFVYALLSLFSFYYIREVIIPERFN